MSDREKPAHISQKDWDEAALPEWTKGDVDQAVPFKDAHPVTFETWKRGRGRPKVARPKVKVGWRLSADVVDAVKATGKGYNVRVETVLREAIAKGLL